jgi:hypothetical protein
MSNNAQYDFFGYKSIRCVKDRLDSYLIALKRET